MSAHDPVRTPIAAPASAARLARLLLMMWTSSIIVMSIGALSVSYYLLHQQIRSHLQTLSAFTAVESRAALEFRDTEAASEILHSIPAAEGITHAQLLDASGVVLAEVRDTRDDAGSRLARWLGDERVVQDVNLEHGRSGRVVLEGGSGPLLRTLGSLLGWCLLVMLSVALGSLALARHYTHRITQPIQQLRNVVQRLIERRDSQQRAPRSDLAEVEELRKDFNVLLDEIDTRDRQLTQTNAALQRVAYIDTVTGLPNRAMFEQLLLQTIETCTHAQTSVGLLYLDIDAFKQVNDTLGHDAGDALLAEIGARLRAGLGVGGVAARLGGDEFVVLVAPLGEPDALAQFVARLQLALDGPVRLNGKILHPGVSIGTAVYPEPARSADELIRLADQAMYRAKDSRYRQNRVTRWTPAEAESAGGAAQQ
jgi:diguanylate cyclase (GGDEF)-like protein